MIVHASFLPYPPLTSLSSEGGLEIPQTYAAYDRVREEVYAAHPDYIIFIGKPLRADATFQLSVSDTFHLNLTELGDFKAYAPFEGTKKIAHALQDAAMRAELPFRLVHESSLATGVSIVARQLFEARSLRMPLGVLSYADASLDDHWTMGQTLREVLEERTDRVALIAVGNLSHCVYQRKRWFTPSAGYEFDAAVQEALTQQSPEKLRYLKESLITKA